MVLMVAQDAGLSADMALDRFKAAWFHNGESQYDEGYPASILPDHKGPWVWYLPGADRKSHQKQEWPQFIYKWGGKNPGAYPKK